jgi:hypothetical protein
MMEDREGYAVYPSHRHDHTHASNNYNQLGKLRGGTLFWSKKPA